MHREIKPGNTRMLGYGNGGYSIHQALERRADCAGVVIRIAVVGPVIDVLQDQVKLNATDRSFNRKNNRTRARGEHAFCIVKDLWGCSKVRYRGLEKKAAQVFVLFALVNLYLCRRELSALRA